MTYFAVVRERGPAWDWSVPMPEQDSWQEHAAFMNTLVADGFVLAGGPLEDGARILLIVHAESEAGIRARLAADPWSPMELLSVATVDRWHVLLGDVATSTTG